MRKTLLCCTALTLLAPVAARGAPEPAAANGARIEEKLGAKIPLGLQLDDEKGSKVALRQLVDKPTVLTLNYFKCGGICSPQLNEIARLLNEIDLEPGRDFQILTVSFDGADTPEIAAQKRVNYLKLLKRPFPPAAWRFLTGEAVSTKSLADAVGFHFAKHGETFVHPGALIILSPEGTVTRYIYGIKYLPAELEMAVGDAARGEVRPTVSKVLAFCFSYDPEGRRYVLDVTRLAGLGTLLLAGVLVVAVLLRGGGRDKAGGLPR